MEYGSVLGAATGGLGGGAIIAVLPNTGGSLRVVAVIGLLSIAVGLLVLASVFLRSIASRKFSTS